ncbi:hypothetical protein CCR94_13820 [Rhodoblastus sphagnicola]|uniref:Uncharacterized protein n=1 Tax=Rhodoblastus sphagnicola TaxID=333368 RepID=A0A2S6N5P4_9HYPH|nr:restriction endonuclease [Rhodoblastus sphagnicola]MBB4201037.1 hypothetical protein [Rhodoblastus sphagnicola]PPQ29934.1 hypothetical protein CCR94_13820 [Rhodoblastus sphagnicola]
MPSILTRDSVEAELAQVRRAEDADAGATRAAYGALTPEDFELLLYDLFRADGGSGEYYDTATLMITGADRGRDVWLTREERPSGLVQCKRVAGAFTVPDTVREVIKFLLFAEIDKSLLPDAENFQYNLAVSSEPAGKVVGFFTAPITWFRDNDADIEKHLREVVGKYTSFDGIDVPSVLPRMKTRLLSFRYSLIRPVDLDERLEHHPSVRARFFRVRQVIDHESMRAMLDAKFEAEQRRNQRFVNPLSQALLDEEVRREIERIRRRRFFDGANTQDDAAKLTKRLVGGDLSSAADGTRSAAIGACARWQALKGEPDRIQQAIDEANRLGDSEDARIASAFLVAKTDWQQALAALAPVNSGPRRMAALQVVLGDQGPVLALQWCTTAEIDFLNLDSDGRHVLLTVRLQAGDWDGAFADAVRFTDEDFISTPAALWMAAVALLGQAVPGDLRSELLGGAPFAAREFPLADNENALANRREAARLSRLAEIAATKLECKSDAVLFACTALWLELRDSQATHEAMQRLQAHLSDGESAMPFLPLALSFHVPLDLDFIERVLARREALQPLGSSDLAVARLSLAVHQANAEDAADYFLRHRELILRHLKKPEIYCVEIRLLIEAGRHELARERLSETENELDPAHLDLLKSAVAQSSNEQLTAELEAQYERQPSTVHLARLVDQLRAQGYSDRYFELGRKLVTTTKVATDAEHFIHFLLCHERHDEAAMVLDDIEDVVSTSATLRGFLAWSRYRQGNFKEASRLVEALRSERDTANDRALFVNILIATGRWPELGTFVEAEWAVCEKRSAEELLGISQLAARINSPRLWTLLQATATHPDADARILLGCYITATQAGRENEPEVGRWFQDAVSLSGEDGPIKHASLDELISEAPAWSRHVDDVWAQLRKGAAPLAVVAQVLHRSSLEMQLAVMVANREQPDPRRRGVIPAFSGARGAPDPQAATIGLSGSALVTLTYLGEIERVIQRDGGITIPHSTLSWLFEERGKLAFHQPSRIKAAHAMSRAIARMRLHRFTAMSAVEGQLAEAVGPDLATMLSSAIVIDDTRVQRIVVRSAPVHKLGSLRREEADLSCFSNVLCSCLAVIDKLAERGHLTLDEEEYARAYLERQETRWPREPTIQDGAELYLDDLSVAYLRTTRVLDKLAAAGLKAFVSEREIHEANAFIELETRAEAIDEVVERLRRTLASGIERGAVATDSMFKADKLAGHPDVAVLHLAGKVDAIVCDDRFMNQHLNMEGKDGSSVIWTSLDAIRSLNASDSQESLCRHRTALRQAGYILISASADELIEMIARAKTRDSSVVETGELRAYRENLQLAQMRGWLSLPLEAHWFDTMLTDLANAVVAQWNDDVSEADARARSKWLLERADLRNWAGQTDQEDNLNMARFGLAIIVNSLLLSHSCIGSREAAARFEKWLEDVVDDLKNEDLTIYNKLVEASRATVLMRVAIDV